MQKQKHENGAPPITPPARGRVCSRAFTIIELILGISILLVAGTFGLFILDNQLHGSLEAEAEVIASRIEDAQGRALAGMENSSWGIRFFNATTTQPYYELFKGSSYSSAESTFFLDALIEYETLSKGTTTDIVFTKLSGRTTTSTTVSIRLTSDPSSTKTITVTPKGKITVE